MCARDVMIRGARVLRSMLDAALHRLVYSQLFLCFRIIHAACCGYALSLSYSCSCLHIFFALRKMLRRSSSLPRQGNASGEHCGYLSLPVRPFLGFKQKGNYPGLDPSEVKIVWTSPKKSHNCKKAHVFEAHNNSLFNRNRLEVRIMIRRLVVIIKEILEFLTL